MTTIITRELGVNPKPTPLTNEEMDQNFINLNEDKAEKSIVDSIEKAVTGRAIINTWESNSHVLVESNEARCAVLDLKPGTGGTAITAAGQVICPATSKVYVVSNSTGYLITFKTAAGTGVDISDATSMLLVCDGTNVIEGITQSAGGGVPVGSALTLVSQNSPTGYSADITIDGSTYQRQFANVAYDPAVHDLTALKANAQEALCYGSYQVTGTYTHFNWVTYSASLDLYVAVGSSNVGLYNTIYTSPDAATWTARTAPVTTMLNYVFFANSLFVAVGASGTILTSPDGITWTQRTSGTSINITGGTYSASDSKFVVVATVPVTSCVMLTSPDGITWTKVMDGQVLRGIAYSSADNVYVAVGDAGAIYTSPDRVSWTYRTSGVTTALNAVAYSAADDLFVAVGASGVILTSANGTSWTVRTSGVATALNGVCYSAADDLFVVVGASGTIITSANGTSWTARTSPTTAQLNAVAYSASDDVYVAVGNGGVAVKSSDGITWTLTLNNQQVNGIAYSAADAIYVAIGAGGAIWTSADTIAWTYQQSGTTQILYSVAYSSADDKFVAVGGGGVVLTSPDGVTWTSRSSGTTNTLYGITYSSADDIFVAVGGSGTVITSSDGLTWTARTSNTSSQLNAVAYDSVDDKFVAVGAAGTIIYSADGVTWTVGAAASNFNSVAYSSGLDLYVAVCDSGLIYTSPDQAAWTKRTSGVSTALRGVVWSSDFSLFIAVGASGTIITSPDGVTWTSRTSGTSLALNAVDAGNSIVVAVGNDGTSSVILKSTNGTTYAVQTTTAYANSLLNSVQYRSSGTLFVAGGSNDFIITSTDATTWTNRSGIVSASGGPICGAYNPSTGMYVLGGISNGVSTSTDLVNWKYYLLDGTVSSNYVYGLTYSSSLGMFLATTGNGKIYTSTDGATWTNQTSGTTNALIDPFWDATLGLFIVIGTNVILTSPDGVTWTSRLAAGGSMRGVYNSTTSTYLAISTSATYSSVNGTTWTLIGSGVAGAGWSIAYFPVNQRYYSGSSYSLDGITWTASGAYYNGAWGFFTANNILFTGGGDGVGNRLGYSIDGVNWTQVGMVSYNYYPLPRIYNSASGLFVGSSGYGNVFTLPSNAVSFTTVNQASTINSFAYLNSNTTSVAVTGSGAAILSTDGITWTKNLIVPLTAQIVSKGVTYDATNSLWVACASNGNIHTSTNATTWTAQTSNTTSSLNAIIANSTDGIMAMGAGNIRQRSSNGTTWTLGYAGGTPNALNGVTYGAADDRVVAVGAAGNILTSPDGIAWTYVTPPTTSAFNAITYDSTNDLFIAVGASGTIYTSPDSTTWTARTSNAGTTALTCAYFDTTVKDRVGGASGVLLSSTNGTGWTAGTVSTAQNLLGVTYGSADDKIVVVGAAGTILTSPDGSAWTARSSNISTSINAVCYDSTTDLFCAVAYSLPAGAPAVILTSPDGVTWTQRNGAIASQSNSGLLAITSTSTDGFVAVGGTTSIVKSTNGTSWSVALCLNGLYKIAYSSSLDKFVWVGGVVDATAFAGGYILTSSDALTWTVTKYENTVAYQGQSTYPYYYQYNFTDVCFDTTNGIFVAIGGSYTASYNIESCVYTSSDGISWTKRTLPLNLNLTSVTSGNGVIGVLCSGTAAGSKIVTSTDGVTWNKSIGIPSANGQLYSITYGSDIQKFVVSGGLGLIYISNTTNSGSPTSVYQSTGSYMRTK